MNRATELDLIKDLYQATKALNRLSELLLIIINALKPFPGIRETLKKILEEKNQSMKSSQALLDTLGTKAIGSYSDDISQLPFEEIVKRRDILADMVLEKFEEIDETLEKLLKGF